MNKKIVVSFAAFILILILLISLIQQKSSTQVSTRAVKISANLPLTGYFSVYGSAVRDGVLLFEKDNPKSKKILQWDWQDNTGDPKNTVTIYQRQKLSSPDIYVSGVKPQTMAIQDAVRKEGIPHFVWIFDPQINPKKGIQNNIRTWVSYKLEPDVFLYYAKKRKPKKILIVYVQLPHTIEEFENIVKPRLKRELGTEVKIKTEVYDYGKKDFKDIAIKARNFSPDLIILNGFQAELVNLTKVFLENKLIKNGNTIATYDMLDAASLLTKDELSTVRFVAPIFVTRQTDDKIANWRKKFKDTFGREPLYTHAFAYDMANVLFDIAQQNTPKSSADWLSAIKSYVGHGVTGPLKFDADGDLLTPLEVGCFKNGKPCPVSD